VTPEEPRYARPRVDRPARLLVAGLFLCLGALLGALAAPDARTLAMVGHAAAGAALGAGAGLAWTETVRRAGGRMQWRRDTLWAALWTVTSVAGTIFLARSAHPAAPPFVAAAFAVPLARAAAPVAAAWATVAAATALTAAGAPATAAGVLAAGIFVTVAPGPRHRSAFRWAPASFGTAAAVAAAATAAATILAGPGLAHAGPWHTHPVLAVTAGMLLGLPTGLAFVPIYDRVAGHATRSQLFDLADLGNPLLEHIASCAPGTWQHSRAMANLAEQAANAIGADALLVRVGAYYHDLGKAEAPRFFVENLEAGAKNPHDALPPEQSAARIVAHVREGVRKGRAGGLPEDLVDFMHTHHGDGRVEYFWQRALREDRPRPPDERAFRYPGARPFSRETGILAIVDAVEAATRTLERPSRRDLEQVVRQIVFSKLLDGQLDDSELTPADLRAVATTLVESLLAAAHERVRYPWQEPRSGAPLRWDASDGHVPLEHDGVPGRLRVLDGRGEEP